jgi:hypothetical protein
LGHEKCSTFILRHLVQYILLSRIEPYCNEELMKEKGKKEERVREGKRGREGRRKNEKEGRNNNNHSNNNNNNEMVGRIAQSV